MPRAKKSGSKGKRGGAEISTGLGGPGKDGVHAGSRDASYRGTVHWDGNTAGHAWLIKPPGGARVPLEYCHPLPVSGEFDIETQGGAHVTRDP